MLLETALMCLALNTSHEAKNPSMIGQDATAQVDIPQTGGIGGLIPNIDAISPPDISQQPVQAFVVENDISNSQALQEELEIQATL